MNAGRLGSLSHGKSLPQPANGYYSLCPLFSDPARLTIVISRDTLQLALPPISDGFLEVCRTLAYENRPLLFHGLK